MAGRGRRPVGRRRAGAGLVVSLTVTVLALLPGIAVAADDPGGSPSLPAVSASAPATSSRPSASSTQGPPATSATSVTSTHRAAPSTTHRHRSSTPYRGQSTRTAAPYSVSESATGGPTQTFVLGSASLGSLSDSTAAGLSPTSGSTSDDSTGHYVHVFFAVVVAAAVLLLAGLTGLALTRDGTKGRHQ